LRGHAVYVVDGAVRQQVGEVALFLLLLFAEPQVVLPLELQWVK
jgi:hypothetical protein